MVVKMSFLIKDDEVWDKYDKIWDAIKNKLGIKFHSQPVYKYSYLKAKVKSKRIWWCDKKFDDVPKESMNYTCIACITIDSVFTIDKKNHSQIYLEKCKHRIKKMQMSKFINAKLKSNSESPDSDLEPEKIGAKFDKELMAKLEKSGSDSE